MNISDLPPPLQSALNKIVDSTSDSVDQNSLLLSLLVGIQNYLDYGQIFAIQFNKIEGLMAIHGGQVDRTAAKSLQMSIDVPSVMTQTVEDGIAHYDQISSLDPCTKLFVGPDTGNDNILIFIEDVEAKGNEKYFIYGADIKRLSDVYKGNLSGLNARLVHNPDLSKENLGKVYIRSFQKIERKIRAIEEFMNYNEFLDYLNK